MDLRNLKYIKDKMVEYSKIPSLTRREGEFRDYLFQDMAVGLTSTRKSWQASLLTYPECLFVTPQWKDAKTTIMIHIDRIPVQPFEFTFDGGYWVGQHDNVISVAIARWLMWKKVPFNFLFTPREENCSNGQLIRDYVVANPDQNLIDLDIDVSVDKRETLDGLVSIRRRDNLLKYPEAFVKKLTALCVDNGIPYTHKDEHWLIVQLGVALREAKVLPPNYSYIGIPLIDYHSNHEIASEKCVRGVLQLLTAYAKEKA